VASIRLRVKRLEAGESYGQDVPADELAVALESGRFRSSASEDACAHRRRARRDRRRRRRGLLTEHEASTAGNRCRHARYVLNCQRVHPGPSIETI
jgi:hypothetical protein